MGSSNSRSVRRVLKGELAEYGIVRVSVAKYDEDGILGPVVHIPATQVREIEVGSWPMSIESWVHLDDNTLYENVEISYFDAAPFPKPMQLPPRPAVDPCCRVDEHRPFVGKFERGDWGGYPTANPRGSVSELERYQRAEATELDIPYEGDTMNFGHRDVDLSEGGGA